MVTFQLLNKSEGIVVWDSRVPGVLMDDRSSNFRSC